MLRLGWVVAPNEIMKKITVHREYNTINVSALLKYDLDMNSVDLYKKPLDETEVLFLPGSILEMEGYLRVGYCSEVSKLEKGLKLFDE
ncbi:hypothetical protein IKJ53_02425 [bacterium]|nr:hypothetical protein [bacterium]